MSNMGTSSTTMCLSSPTSKIDHRKQRSGFASTNQPVGLNLGTLILTTQKTIDLEDLLIMQPNGHLAMGQVTRSVPFCSQLKIAWICGWLSVHSNNIILLQVLTSPALPGWLNLHVHALKMALPAELWVSEGALSTQNAIFLLILEVLPIQWRITYPKHCGWKKSCTSW